MKPRRREDACYGATFFCLVQHNLIVMIYKLNEAHHLGQMLPIFLVSILVVRGADINCSLSFKLI